MLSGKYLLLINTCCICCLLPTLLYAQALKVEDLTCEGQQGPLSVEEDNPRFSWKLASGQRNVKQNAYQVLVSDDPAVKSGNLWDSRLVESDQSLWINYEGKTLQDGHRYYWKVQVSDNQGNTSSWSRVHTFKMGLRENGSWQGAQWIGWESLPDEKRIVPAIPHTQDKGLGRNTLPVFRRAFTINKPVKEVTAYVSGLGHFELRLNGQPVSDHFLDPAWTDYDKTCFYVAYDLTNQVKQKENVLGLLLGNGMYFVPKERYRKFVSAFGYPKAIVKLVILYEGGSEEVIVSDRDWQMSRSPITFTSIFGGEDFDARLWQDGWDNPGFDDSSWAKAKLVKAPQGDLKAQLSLSLKILDTLRPIDINQPKPGVWIYDLGQNASGIPAISVKGYRGQTVKITPGELLDDEGLVTQQASGSPCYFQYTLSGDGVEYWQPKFTYYGFRYLQVEGSVPDAALNPAQLPRLKKVMGLHTRSVSPVVGSFYTSDTLFQQIYELINWSVKSNLSHVLTDCPHREKLGWLEVPYLMGHSIQYNFNIHHLYNKQVSDMRDSQLENGMVPDIAPEYPVFGGGFRDSPEWGSAIVIIPWELYKWYGDMNPMKKAYPAMKQYVEYLRSKAEDNLISYGLGDWFDIGPKVPGESQLTPNGVTATAIYYYDLTLISKMANLLGKPADAATYDSLAQAVRKSFNGKYLDTSTFQYATGSQTANAMPLYLGLVDKEHEQLILRNIINDIRDHNNSITAGDIGFRFLIQTLEKYDRPDVIFDMNHQVDRPGYGYQLVRGATSLTESWQAFRFVSNNHCMLGHLMEWFYSGLAGIEQADGSIAYRHVYLRPQLVGNIEEVESSFESPYGQIVSKWKKGVDNLTYHVEIPPNCQATLALPVKNITQVKESKKGLEKSQDIKVSEVKHERLHLNIGSGIYDFEIKLIEHKP